MAAKVKLNSMGKFIAVCLVKYEVTLGELETLLELPTNSLNNIGRHGTRRLDERFLKLPSVLDLSEEETAEFNKLCEEYMEATKPNGKYPFNPLGEFIRHLQLKYHLKNNTIEETLDLNRNYLGGLMRRRMVSLNDKFMKFPEVFHLTEEETAKFKDLCEKYIQAHPVGGYGRNKGKLQLPERLLPLLNIIRDNAFMISDSAIHACVSCLKRDVEHNLVSGSLDG